MAINTNGTPYYDDFDPTKNYHRILFRPGRSVQGRELTQSQTILQNQVTSFASHIFSQNTPVSGGRITYNLGCSYLKLNTTYNNSSINVSDYLDQTISNETGTILAKVIAYSFATGTTTVPGDPPTLILSYLTGNTFEDSTTIYKVVGNSRTPFATTIGTAGGLTCTGISSTASISDGVFYVITSKTATSSVGESIPYPMGIFVNVTDDTIILDKYTNTPSYRVGLEINEEIVSSLDDSSLLDPALGSSNYQAPGADRYKLSLSLVKLPLSLGGDENFIELLRIENGVPVKKVEDTSYDDIDDYFAKRDYETNGDYIVQDFKLVPTANPSSNNSYIMNVGKGLAYVHGYRIENTAEINIVTNRARTTESQNNNPVFINYGSYFYVDTLRGNTSFFNVTNNQAIDIHCVPTSNISTANANTYTSTLVGKGYLRNLEFNTNTGSNSNTASYIYKAFVYNINANTMSANVVSATTSTVTFPSYFSSSNNAYTGVSISISTGTDAGDFRTITAYDGVSKIATVNRNWTVTPDTSSVFKLNFAIADAECIVAATTSSYPATVSSSANINNLSKVNGVVTGYTVLENPNTPELIFPVGNPYVSQLSGTSYTTTQEYRNLGFTSSGSGVSSQLNYEGDYLNIIKHFGTAGSTLSDELIKQNFIIVVTDKGSNSTVNVGDVIPWTSPNRTVTLDVDASIATFYSSDLSPFSASIIAKVFVENGDNLSLVRKVKNYIKANTNVVVTTGTTVNTYTHVDNSTLTSSGQVYIENAGLLGPGVKQSLYLSDVKELVAIIDTKSISSVPTLDMLSFNNWPNYDIKYRYFFDNGQRDGYYDHASITLVPGAQPPKGNILVLVNYYQHSGGDGYFCKESYIDSATLKDDYRNLPTYTAINGITYNLRDCLDYRPSRVNATTAFNFRYANPSDTTRYGTLLPVDITTFISSLYSYYLPRLDKLVLTKDKSFQMIEGTPSLTPVSPKEPDGALVIANISLDPYTGYLPFEVVGNITSNLSIQKVQHRRYTMQDIAGLESRISNVEYYTSLSVLEQNTQALQISDSYGLNRYKNGILTDDFSGFSVSDTYNSDFLASVNRRTKQMSCAQNVLNFPLKDINLLMSGGQLSSSTLSSLNYSINKDGFVTHFSLPYTTSSIASQILASRTVNVNPFAVALVQGTLSLSPNMDVWVDNFRQPSILVTDPNLNIYTPSNNLNVLKMGDWQTVSTTTVEV